MSIELNLIQALFGLFISAFTSATILPGTSEIALVALLKQFPSVVTAALAVATIANTLGGMTTYAMGRFLPQRRTAENTTKNTQQNAKSKALLQRYGASALLLSWVPVIGDGLCLAAGWLRLNWLPCLLSMAVGKLLRYVLLVQAMQLVS